MTPEEKVLLLNRALHGTVNSVVQYIDIAAPYVPAWCEAKVGELKRLRDEEAHTANELVALVTGLDGVPQVDVFPYWNVDLNYLDVRFLARFAVDHQRKVIADLEAGLPDVREDPRIFAALERILDEKRAHLGVLEEIAAIPTPPADPERVKKAVPAESQHVPRPVRAKKPAAPRGRE
jgi:bacterioferritin (cytochrome b1)